MTILDQAARALALSQSGVDEFDALDEHQQQTLRENAAAVLRAVREPSEAAIDAGARWHDHYAGADTIGAANAKRNVRQVWRQMIDTALGEE